MYVGLSHHLQTNSILIWGQFDVRKVLSAENTALELTLYSILLKWMLEELFFVSHELFVDNRPFWHWSNVDQDSVGGLATRYGHDSPRIESWWGATFSAPT